MYLDETYPDVLFEVLEKHLTLFVTIAVSGVAQNPL